MRMLPNKPERAPRQDARNVPTYTIPEAAVYLGINRWTLSEWYEGSEPILKASGSYLNNGNIRLLSFRDLEEAYKLYLLRTKHQKSMQYLQKAMVDARTESGSDHPLLDCKMVVFHRIALDKPATGNKPRRMIPLGAGHQTSLYIPEVLEAWGKRIVEDESGKRTQIFPWKESATDDLSRPVSLDASVLSGRLVVTGTRIPVDVLMGYYQSGKTMQEIARLYGLDVETVRKAIHHVEPEQKVS